MSFSPIGASKAIGESYRRYLSTIFQIADAQYQAQFENELNQTQDFSKGPYLDVTDAFQKGQTVTDLIREGKLPNAFSRLNVHQDRALYRHQEAAITKIGEGKNLIVSTGTGSGKTESFLYPILAELTGEFEAGQLNPGVRALLIYPMNALANDQIERLREILTDFPEITYGSYTGQTLQTYAEALQEYRALNEGREPKKNELISREQMQKTPPHLLITNYAMLEYLLVRPKESELFEPRFTQKWKFIVLDEAHVYHGSTGIEVAMLLRRLKARLGKDDIQYILTSATLGNENENEAVAAFGRNLCNSDFSQDDVIRADRLQLKAPDNPIDLGLGFYHTVAEAISQNVGDEKLIAILEQEGLNTSGKKVEEILYNYLVKDRQYWLIRQQLDIPQTVAALMNRLNLTESDIAAFVTVATRAVKDGGKLFDARYHTFLRAPESVFITLSPSKKLFLTGKKTHVDEDGSEYAVFEAATCTHCHTLYLLGRIVQNKLHQTAGGDGEPRSAFLLGKAVEETDDEHTLDEAGEQLEEYELCACCGAINHVGSPHNCGHDAKYYHVVTKVQLTEEKSTLTKCPKCENTNTSGILRSFFAGQEAVTSVVGTSLFEQIPSTTVQVTQPITEEDEFGFGASSEEMQIEQTNAAKQFIAFSDNRQGAAYYATYLDQSYRNILYKRIIIEALKQPVYATGNCTMETLAEDVAAIMERQGVASSSEAVREGWKAVLHETSEIVTAHSLPGLGLLSFSVNQNRMRPNTKLNLSADEVRIICNVFMETMLAEGAVECPVSMTPEHRAFYLFQGIQTGYSLSDSNAQRHIKSFIPSNSRYQNRRTDYLRKVLAKKGIELSSEDITRNCEGFWKAFFEKTLMQSTKDGFRINPLELVPAVPNKVYRCAKCHRVTAHNISNVCPAYHCDGELKELIPADTFKDDHYYNIYQELEIRPLRVVEHTAQLEKDIAYDYQKKFKTKQLDILSCSTTFEMGVDVGSLETVFMRNMPPSPANYAQRAGRAGRSIHSAAFALTFCTKSSHDFSYFKAPERMIRGKIDPPVFEIENAKIAIRHLYASVFGIFWRQHPELFADVTTFFDGNPGETGFDLFRKFLEEKPIEVAKYLSAFLPKSLASTFHVNGFGWVKELTDSQEGFLETLNAEYKEEVDELQKVRDEYYREGRRGIDALQRRINTFQKENLLTYLARKGVFPKYGFPVDTVELEVSDKNGSAGRLSLQRDLAVAISEYAPGSQIVANGNLITSRYIRTIPSRQWKMSRYCRCDKCQSLNLRTYIPGDTVEYTQCDTCHEELKGIGKVYLIPEFGFVADSDSITKPGLKKPIRTYRGEVSYLPKNEEPEYMEYAIGSSSVQISMASDAELAVINDSNFFVCESCGYAELDSKNFHLSMRKKHKKKDGYPCVNERLTRYSLAYRFKTDAVQIRFPQEEIYDTGTALSLLNGILEGISDALNIERSDIAGCLTWYQNTVSHTGNYGFLVYDSTPGGAGHVKRIQSKEVLMQVFYATLEKMERCNCGGPEMETSCYSCLRNYYNQKYHDLLQRGIVVRFFRRILG